MNKFFFTPPSSYPEDNSSPVLTRGLATFSPPRSHPVTSSPYVDLWCRDRQCRNNSSYRGAVRRLEYDLSERPPGANFADRRAAILLFEIASGLRATTDS